MEPNSARMDGKTLMVTSTTSGIGKIRADKLARIGATVIAVRRDQDRSEKASHDRETAATLWKASEELTGLAASPRRRLHHKRAGISGAGCRPLRRER